MKTPIRSSKRNFFGGVLFGFLVVILMFGAVGCSKDKKGNGNPYYYGGSGFNGWNGSSNGGFSAMGNDYTSRVELALQFSINGGASQYPYYATGQVLGQGELTITQAVACNSGGSIQPGRYVVSSTQPGQISNGVIQGLQLIAQGPSGQVNMYISQAVVIETFPKMYSCNGPQIFDELAGSVMIQGVNGYSCMQSVYLQTQGTAPVCR